MRAHVQQDRNRVINRIARRLATVNLKLASVASNIVGVSGLAILRLPASGAHDPERLAECARGLRRVKMPALVQALEGRPDVHFRWMLSDLLRKLDWLEEERTRLEARLKEFAKPLRGGAAAVSRHSRCGQDPCAGAAGRVWRRHEPVSDGGTGSTADRTRRRPHRVPEVRRLAHPLYPCPEFKIGNIYSANA